MSLSVRVGTAPGMGPALSPTECRTPKSEYLCRYLGSLLFSLSSRLFHWPIAIHVSPSFIPHKVPDDWFSAHTRTSQAKGRSSSSHGAHINSLPELHSDTAARKAFSLTVLQAPFEDTECLVTVCQQSAPPTIITKLMSESQLSTPPHLVSVEMLRFRLYVPSHTLFEIVTQGKLID